MLPPSTEAVSRRSRLVVCGVIAAAFGLRLSGIGSGAPFRMGVDEPVVIGVALRMMKTGDFNPHFYDYGGLTLYLQMAMASLRFLAGAMSRKWVSLNQVWEGDFLIWARFLSVALGTFTVFLVYRAGLRWGSLTALVAACAMAVHPQHVRDSHFALTDTPLAFFVALTLLLSLRASEQKSNRAFFFAGLTAGLAAATKYNGALAWSMPIVAAIALPTAAASASAIAAATSGAVVGFLAGAPYSVIDLPGFLNGFAGLMQHYNQPRSVAEAAVTYFKYMRGWFTSPFGLPMSFGWIGFAVCLLGLLRVGAQARYRTTRAPALALTVFPITYFWLISKEGSLQYGRYLLPLTPMLSIAFGVGLVAIRARLMAHPTTGRRLAAGALFLLLLPPIASSVERNIADSRVGTPEQAAFWLVQNVKPDEPVLIEADLMRLPPRIRSTNVLRLIDEPPDRLRENGIAYLVASSSESDRYFAEPARRSSEVERYLQMMASGQVVLTVRPSADHPGPTVTILKIARP